MALRGYIWRTFQGCDVRFGLKDDFDNEQRIAVSSLRLRIMVCHRAGVEVGTSRVCRHATSLSKQPFDERACLV
jgi:hypothetical protein